MLVLKAIGKVIGAMENSPYWVLDVTMNEDGARKRKEHHHNHRDDHPGA